MKNIDLVEMDRSSLFHANSSIAELNLHGPQIYRSGHGMHVEDNEGRRYLDMVAGLWCVNLGYGREELPAAAAKAMSELPFQHLFGSAASPPAIELADRLLSLFREKAAAPHMARCFFGSSGSDANDTAYKLVRYYHNLIGKPAKKKVIARIGGYHGLTYAATGLTGISAYHKCFDMPLEGMLHVTCPHHYRHGLPGESEAEFSARLVQELRDVIEREGPETIAAFWAEPVMGAGGVMPPPAGYFEGIQAVLAEHDILFVVDEVVTGFGRTGDWFGTGRYGLKPDLVNLAKGLTCGYLPLSATLVSDRMWSVFEATSSEVGAFMHGFTYSGHPVCCAVALATLDIMEREDIVGPVAAAGTYLLDQLQARLGDNPYVGHIRGAGLMTGVEFVADRATKRPFAPSAGAPRMVAAKARELGLLTRALPFASVAAFSPPLIVSHADIDVAVDRLAMAVDLSMTDLSAAAAIG